MSYNLIISCIKKYEKMNSLLKIFIIDKYTIFKMSNKIISKFLNLFIFNKLKLQLKNPKNLEITFSKWVRK